MSTDRNGTESTGADGQPGFGDALAELERIVAELETDDLDVDRLAERVSRAGELVRTCRARLDAARFAVEDVLERAEGE